MLSDRLQEEIDKLKKNQHRRINRKKTIDETGVPKPPTSVGPFPPSVPLPFSFSSHTELFHSCPRRFAETMRQLWSRRPHEDKPKVSEMGRIQPCSPNGPDCYGSRWLTPRRDGRLWRWLVRFSSPSHLPLPFFRSAPSGEGLTNLSCVLPCFVRDEASTPPRRALQRSGFR
jgi:hypothetical protein